METSGWSMEVLVPGSAMAEWDAFVDSSPQGSIYCKSWWLQAVAPDTWQILMVTKGGSILAGLPLVLAHVRGETEVRMPQLTQTLGPLFTQLRGEKYAARLTAEIELTRRLIDAIPACRRMSLRTPYTFTNWLPFYWAGWSQTTRYTYVLENLTDLEQVWEGMESNTRGKIRKAEKAGIRISEIDDVDAFLAVSRMTFERQGMRLPYSMDLVLRLDAACRAHDARRIYLAKDAEDRIHSALYVVFDASGMINLMQGGDPELRSSGANLLAMWHSIQFASTVTRRYDFEGSMLPNVEPVFRGFGAIQRPYFSLSKDNRPRWLQMLDQLRK
jgi:hypothetical protein